MTIYHPGMHIELLALCDAGKESGFQPAEFKSNEFGYSFTMKQGETKSLFCDFGAEFQDIMAWADEYYCSTFEEVYYFTNDEAKAIEAEQELRDIHADRDNDRFDIKRDGTVIYVTLKEDTGT